MCPQDLLRQITAKPDGAERINLFVFREFVETVAQIVKWDIYCTFDRSERVFCRCTYIKQKHFVTVCPNDIAP